MWPLGYVHLIEVYRSVIIIIIIISGCENPVEGNGFIFFVKIWFHNFHRFRFRKKINLSTYVNEILHNHHLFQSEKKIGYPQ